MEIMINNVKRKKRRTRKCLDEIRKRAHSFSCRNELKENKFNTKSFFRNSSNFNQQCITIHRLTLFPRAIKSETITRSSVPVKLDNNPVKKRGKNILDTNITPSNVSNSKEPVNVIKDCISDAKSYNRSYGIDSDKRDAMGKYKYESSQSSFNILSPINNKNNRQSSSLSDVSSPRSHGDCGYELYEEFIDDVPTYLKQNAPSILNEDVMSDTRSYLHNLYLEESPTHNYYSPQNTSFYISSDNSINSSPDTILQNPKDYLRQHLMCRPANSNTVNGSPLQVVNIPYSQQTTSSSQCPVTEQTLSIIHITPEYNFYPHKLNN